MKKIILIVITICSFQISFGQYDDATQSKIKVKFFAAEELLEKREYSKAIEKVNEIEVLTNGPKASVVQNIKVKSYIGLSMYEQAKKELNVLYKLNPSDEVLKDIASYESRINDGIAKEKADKERAMLAEIKREEDARLAVIKRDKERKERVEKINKDYISFKKKYNIETDNFLEIGENGNVGLVSKNGDIIIPYEYSKWIYKQFSGNLFTVYKKGNDLLNIKTGKFILKNMKSIGELKDGVAIVVSQEVDGCIIDSSGNILTKRWYYVANDFKDGLLQVSIGTGEDNKYGIENRKAGFIDKTGKEVIPLIYDFASSFSDGLAAVERYGKKGYINKKGETVIPFIYEYAGAFKNGRALVGKSSKYNSKRIYINTSGKKVGN